MGHGRCRLHRDRHAPGTARILPRTEHQDRPGRLLPPLTLTVAEGSQGPRSYLFSAQRVRPTSRRKAGEIHWAIYRRNLDGSEPRYYLSNAPEDTPLETLAYVGGSRWRIET